MIFLKIADLFCYYNHGNNIMSDKTHKFFSSSSPSFSVEIVITRLAYKFRNIFDIEMGERVTILEIGHGLCP